MFNFRLSSHSDISPEYVTPRSKVRGQVVLATDYVGL